MVPITIGQSSSHDLVIVSHSHWKQAVMLVSILTQSVLTGLVAGLGVLLITHSNKGL